MRDFILRTFLPAAAGAAIVVLLSAGVSAWADQDPTTDDVPRYLPYRGTLNLDGAVFDGTIDMTFALLDGGTEVWTESRTVTVMAGDFSVLLGDTSSSSVATLQAALEGADDLYLQITLAHDGQTITLDETQRLMPVPMAVWTTAATDFTVDGTLLVEAAAGDGLSLTTSAGTMTLTGSGGQVALTPSGGQLSLNGTTHGWVALGSGDLVVDGATTIASDLRMSGTGLNAVGNSAVAAVAGASAVDINGDASFTYVDFYGGLTVSGDSVSVTGDADIDGDFDSTGSASFGSVSLGSSASLNVASAGSISFSGTVDVGYEVEQCSNKTTCSCESGKKALAGGGGCYSGGRLMNSYPGTDEASWNISCSNNNPSGTWVACARVGN